MKKILIIANLHHASPRIPSFCKYLGDNNEMQFYILTPPYDSELATRYGIGWKWDDNGIEGAKIISAPFKGDIFWPLRSFLSLCNLKKTSSMSQQIKEKTNSSGLTNFILRSLHLLFAFPDTEITWIMPALKAAKKANSTHHFNLIISSSPFPSVHIIARLLQDSFKTPWIADFRDPWTCNHEYTYPFLRRFFEEKLEKFVLKTANLITTASPGYANKMAKIHSQEIFVITNGYHEKFESHSNDELLKKKRFTISYTGKIYWENKRQNPLIILDALRELIDSKQIDQGDLELNFFGKKDLWLIDEIAKRNLFNIAFVRGHLPWESVIQEQKNSHLLLLLNWEDPNSPGVYPGKLFEYLATGRPILATGGFKGDDVERILTETQAGHVTHTVSDTKEILLSMLNTFKHGNLPIEVGQKSKIDFYSFKTQSQRLKVRIQGLLK